MAPKLILPHASSRLAQLHFLHVPLQYFLKEQWTCSFAPGTAPNPPLPAGPGDLAWLNGRQKLRLDLLVVEEHRMLLQGASTSPLPEGGGVGGPTIPFLQSFCTKGKMEP